MLKPLHRAGFFLTASQPKLSGSCEAKVRRPIGGLGIKILSRPGLQNFQYKFVCISWTALGADRFGRANGRSITETCVNAKFNPW